MKKKSPSNDQLASAVVSAPDSGKALSPVTEETGRGFSIVGVGASAGGLEAFTQLLKALPVDTGMGFVLVQHLDPDHQSALVQILQRATLMPVKEITQSQKVEPNQVYVIPRDTSLSIERGELKLVPRQKTRAPHRPIDTFFESLAADQRERAIGIVLSGTATDGTLGLEAIKAEGGFTFAQDDSAKHESMPLSAVASGSVDMVLAPADIAKELARIAAHPFVAGPSEPHRETERVVDGVDSATAENDRGSDIRGERNRDEAIRHEDDGAPLPSGGPADEVSMSGNKRDHAATQPNHANHADRQDIEAGYRKILLHLRKHSGVDFSLYKSSTIQRRIARRLVLSKQSTLDDYAAFLKDNVKELDSLYSDVLISVTSFFRNPEAFETIQHEVLPTLLKEQSDDPVRCWVLGCSTGQEAYSLAMAFVEVVEKLGSSRSLQIFATDLNDALLDKARHGLYAKSLVEDISPARLRRFFTEADGGYRVNKSLREMVVFARQNLIADPPFSRMSLISCRNLLIYLEPSLQKKAIPTFHYALRPGGFLLLGASESIGGFTDLFEQIDKKQKIYRKKVAVTPAFHFPRTQERTLGGQDRRPPSIIARGKSAAGMDVLDGLRGELSAQREADRIAINRYAPPAVLINTENQILQFRGPTGAYLQPPAGKASFDVLKMARDGLMLPLRAAINEAKTEHKTVRREGIRVEQGSTTLVNLEVIPLKNLRERCFLVIFEEPARISGSAAKNLRPALSEQDQAEERGRVSELETDLSEIREFMQVMQEQHDAANEELQVSSEEVQSANEEFQSVDEELETSKEELESANEELITVNEEMNHRNSELNVLNNDLINLQTSTKLAIVLLDRDLSIRRFSPQAEKLFDLLATDVGRPVGHIRHRLLSTPVLNSQRNGDAPASQSPEMAPTDLEGIAAEVIVSEREYDCDVQDQARNWYSLRVRPYKTNDGKVNGAVVVLVDITDRKQAAEIVAEHQARFHQMIDALPVAVYVTDAQGYLTHFNRAANLGCGRTPVLGVDRWCVFGKLFHADGTPMALDSSPMARAIKEGQAPQGQTVIGERPDGSRLWGEVYPMALHSSTGAIIGGINVVVDVTGRRQLEELQRISELRYRRVFEAAKDGILILDLQTGKVTDCNQFIAALLGLESAAVIGKELYHIGLFGDIEVSKKAFEVLKEKKYLRYENLSVKNHKGITVEVEVVANVYQEGSKLVAQCNVRDISQRVEMEKKLNEQSVQIAGESRRKDEFLAMLAHELRNPLAPIRAAVQLMQTNNLAGRTPLGVQALEIISRQAGNITRLVNDLLEVSRVVSGRVRLNRSTVDLNEIVRHAIETTSPLIDHHQHTLVVHYCDLPLLANVDPMRMEEVFINLLNNAAKYSPDGGHIEVWCEHREEMLGATQLVSRYAQVRVRDRGMGVDAELLPRIFDLFSQGDRSLARAQGGLGIGLSLASQLVKQHGGTIVVRSDGPGKGAEFIVRLPAVAASVSSQAQAEQPSFVSGEPLKTKAAKGDSKSDAKSDAPKVDVKMILPPDGETASIGAPRGPFNAPRVLIVDDNVDLVTTLSSLLTLRGFTVRSAYTGPEALKIAREWLPSIAILDIGLPGMDGHEVARNLRADQALAAVGSGGSGEKAASSPIRLVALSGYGRPEDVALAQVSGFDAYLVKPLDYAELEKVITAPMVP